MLYNENGLIYNNVLIIKNIINSLHIKSKLSASSSRHYVPLLIIQMRNMVKKGDTWNRGRGTGRGMAFAIFDQRVS